MYNYKRLILCSFKDFSAENISFKIDEIERISKSPRRGKAQNFVQDTFQPKIFRLKLEKNQEHNGKKICDQPIQKGIDGNVA
jgi:hypothetical protein